MDEPIKTKKKGINLRATAFPSINSGQVWEHQIRDESDFQKHINYIHYNPVKHGLVKKVSDLPIGPKGRIRHFIVVLGKAFMARIGRALQVKKN